MPNAEDHEKFTSIGCNNSGYVFLFNSGRSSFLTFDKLSTTSTLDHIASNPVIKLLATCPTQPYFAFYNDTTKKIELCLSKKVDTHLIGNVADSVTQIIFNIEGSKIALLAQEKRNDDEKHMIINFWQLPKFINNDMTLRQMLFIYALDQYFHGLNIAKNYDTYPSYKISSPDIKRLLNSAAFKEFSLQDRKMLANYLKNCKFPSKYLKEYKKFMLSRTGSRNRAEALTELLLQCVVCFPMYTYLLHNSETNGEIYFSLGYGFSSLAASVLLSVYLWRS